MALIKHISWIIFCTCLASLLMVTLAQEDDVTTVGYQVDGDVTKPDEALKEETGGLKDITEATPMVGNTPSAETQPPTVAETVANKNVTVATEPKEVTTQAAKVNNVTEMPEAAETTVVEPAATTIQAEEEVGETVEVTESVTESATTQAPETDQPQTDTAQQTTVTVAKSAATTVQAEEEVGGIVDVKELADVTTQAPETDQPQTDTAQQTTVTVAKSAATTVQAEEEVGGIVDVKELADVTTQAPETDQPQTDTAQQTTVVVLETTEPVNLESSPASLTEEATQAGLIVDLKNTTDPVQPVQTTSSLDNPDTTLKHDVQTTSGPDTTLKPDVQTTSGPDTTLKPDVQTTSGPDTTLKPDVQTTSGPDTTLKPEAETTNGLQELTTAEKSATSVAVATTQASGEQTVLTTVVEGLTTEEKLDAVPTVVEAVLKSDDPCYNVVILDQDERHLSKKKDADLIFCDILEKQWYGFKYQDQWAEIPSVAIKKGYCSTKIPFRLDLSGDKSLPEFNETVDLQVCTAQEMEGELDECMFRKDIQMRGCDGYYIYYLQPLFMDKCKGAICTQTPGEKVPNLVLANQPAEPEVIPTTEEPLPINSKSTEDLTKEEQAGAVTVTYSYQHGELDRESFLAFEKRLRELVAKYLNENPVEEEPTQTQAMTEQVQDVTTAAGQEEKVSVPTADFVADVSDDSQNSVNDQTKQGTESQDLSQTNSGVRRRRDAAATEQPQYTTDSVTFISPTPRINEDGQLELALIVKDKDGNVVPAEVLKKALENMENPSDDPAIKQEKVSVGLPVDMVMSPAKQPKKDIWDAHMGLWITIIVLVAVCIVTLIVCCVCFRCCDTEDSHPEKSPLQMEEGYKSPSVVIENPLSDDEITRDEAPMLEHENPALTSNGGGQHLTKDEENGWIVPLEQLTDADRQKSDIENTKL